MDIKVRGLNHHFALDPVLVDIDFDLQGRSIVAVIGLNGAGKTTLLRCLAGVIAPRAGIISWDFVQTLRDDLALHRRLLFLSDAPLFLESRNVVEHLVLCLRAYGREATVGEQEVTAILGAFDLLDKAPPRWGPSAGASATRLPWRPFCSSDPNSGCSMNPLPPGWIRRGCWC